MSFSVFITVNRKLSFTAGSLVFIVKKRQCGWTTARPSVTIANLERDWALLIVLLVAHPNTYTPTLLPTLTQPFILQSN